MNRRGCLTALIAATAALALPASALAGGSQNNAPMVVINPGGGIQNNGSDGIQAVFNGKGGYKPPAAGSSTLPVPYEGSDQQFFAGTGQWCCGGASPLLQIGGSGGTLYGEAGAGAGYGTSWGNGNVQVVSTTGSAVVVPTGTTTLPSTPIGSGTALIRYTAVRGGRNFVVDRLIEYRYPSPYYTETYTFTIPSGNTEEVKYYQGGDAAPGDSDAGTGVMVTSPKRVLYEVNPFSRIFVAYGEGEGSEGVFSRYFIGPYSQPWADMAQGIDLPNTVATTNHDAGLEMQWTLGSTPGTYTRNMQTFVNFQDTALSVGFNPDQISTGGTSELLIQVVNTTTDPATGLAFSYTLPSGLTNQGLAAPTSTCGGTFSSTDTSVSQSAFSLSPGTSCLVTVPVKGPDGRYVVNNQDFSVTGFTKGFGSTALTIGNPTFAVNVTKSGSGTGNVSSSPSGIDCGSDCTETWPADQVVNLTATPDSGFVFGGWSGDIGSCVASNPVCQITVDQATTINAQFAVGRSLTVNKTGTGSGTVTSSPAGINCGSDCTETIADGATVTLTAAAAGGSAFAGWSGDAGSCTTATTCTLTMNQARTVTAQFAPTRTMTVTKTGAGSGTVTSSPAGINCGSDCTEPFADGATVTLTANPSGSSAFAGWSGDVPGSCTTSSTCTVTMDQARAITASFAVGRLLTVTTSGLGTGTITSSPAGIDCGSDCTETVPSGNTVTLTASPGANSAFAKWTGDFGACTDTDPTCTVTMDQARTIDAEFSSTRTLTVTPPNGGKITGTGIDCGSDCDQAYPTGDVVTLTAAPDAGKQFKGWGGDCASAGTNLTCEVTMSAARTVSAEFESIPAGTFPLSIALTGPGKVTGPGIDCGSNCTRDVPAGEKVTLTAKANAGNQFALAKSSCPGSVWTATGGAGDAAYTCEVTVSEARTVVAAFEPVNQFVIRSSSVDSKAIDSKIRVPGPGVVSQSATRSYRGRTVPVCRPVTKVARKAGTVSLDCRETAATRAARKKGPVVATVCTTYVPDGGTPRTKCRRIVLPSTKPKYTG